MSFYSGLFIFIASVIAGLALMVGGKGMRRDKFMLLASIHLILLFAFIASLLLKNKDSVVEYNYFFTAFICSGLILSGLAWRSHAPKPMKIYFSVFALTLPLFLLSPSVLLNFLLSMNLSSTNGPSFHLDGQYYLETQSSSRSQDTFPHYKVILKKGIFHQTIQRDIVFGGKIDSIKVLEKDEGKSLRIRGYTSLVTYVSSDVDSVDQTINLKVVRKGDVEYHL
jgi:hypothetical protein